MTSAVDQYSSENCRPAHIAQAVPMNLIMFDISNLLSLGSARRLNLDLVGPSSTTIFNTTSLAPDGLYHNVALTDLDGGSVRRVFQGAAIR